MARKSASDNFGLTVSIAVQTGRSSGCDDYTARKFIEKNGLGQPFRLLVKGDLELRDG